MFKKAILAIAGLLVVLILVALAAPFFISVDTYKSQIIAKVEAATGRTLTIDGALSLSFFPVAGITAEKVTLSNPVGFEDKKPFIALDSMRIDVAVMPLLNKQIVIKNFTLKAPIINLHTDKNGVKNWVFSPQAKMPAEATAAAFTSAPATTAPAQIVDRTPTGHSNPLPAGFMLNNFELKNGTVLYTDGNAPTVELKKLDASVILQSTADAAAINGSGEWNGKTVTVKAGIGTLKSILEGQKTEINVALKSDDFALTSDGFFDKGAFSGKESFKTNSLKGIALWLNPGKPLAITAPLAFKIDSDIRCGASYCSLSNYNFTLDGLTAKGNLKVAFGDSKPVIDITLTTDRLDLNPFLPKQQQLASLEEMLIADANAQTSERWSDQPIDLSALNALNATATIKADSLLYRKIELGRFQLNAKLLQGVLKADVTNAIAYKGTATVSVNLNASQSPAMFDARLLTKGVEVGPLLKDMANFDRLTGAADIEANVQSNCRSMQSLISALAGNGQMQLRGGEIKHFDITDILQNVAGSLDNASKTAKSTVFTKMGGTFTIAGGIVNNRDLAIETQNLTVAGNGTVNLPAYTINYHLLPKLVRTTKDASGTTAAKEGLSVPVIIEGSLDNPQIRPDLNAAVQNVLQDPSKLKEQLKNSKGALKDQLKNPEAVKNIKNLLQGLGR